MPIVMTIISSTFISSILENSQQLRLFVALIFLLLILSLVNNSNPRIATAYFGGTKERVMAIRKAKKQSVRLEKNFSLWVGSLPLTDMQQSMLVSGMPGIGKSYSVIVPATLSAIRQGTSIVLYDYAYPELSQKIAGYAHSQGYDISIFAPGYKESGVINPVEILENSQDIDTAHQFVFVASENQGNNSQNSGDNSFFVRGGVSLVEGAMTLAKSTDFPDLYLASEILALPNLPQRLIHAANNLDPWVRKAFAVITALTDAEKTAAGIIASAQDIMSDFIRPRYISALCDYSSMPLYLEGKQMIILGVDRQRRTVATPILASIIDLLVNKNAVPERSTPILFVLDEAPSIYLPNLSQYLAENRKYGMSFILGTQNQAQLNKVYSQDEAQTIFSTCATKILFNPGEYNSAKLYSDLLGDVQVNFWQRTKNSGKSSSHSLSRQYRTRKLYEPSQLMKMPEGKAIVLNPGFHNRRDIFVPMKQKFKVSTTDEEAISFSEQKWPHLRTMLEEQSWQQPMKPSDMDAYLQAANQLLPMPSS